MKRFSVQIYNAMNRLEKTIPGYATRDAAERIAQQQRDTIERRGWNHTVIVHEAHTVS